ncbi:MAG: hypothetical protein H3C30_16025 [Candidatus Hydrogenedentes bacterium]|nr:hypothetical protein [Candidatus Hydrogenedentota bacterium]
MKHTMMIFCLLVLVISTAFGEEGARCIPYKPDPPIAVDGDLGDWSAVPVAWTLTGETSAEKRVVHVAWREEFFFFAVEIGDSGVEHIQVMSGNTHETEMCRLITFATTFFQQPTVLYGIPEGEPSTGAVFAVKDTERGRLLEAAVPWPLLGLSNPKVGTVLGLEIRKGIEGSQFIPSGGMVAAAVLTGADGQGPPEPPFAEVFSELRLEPGGEQSFSFDAPPCPEGRMPVLSLLARLEFDQVAGYAATMRLTLNGKAVDGNRLLNKPQRVKARSGDMYSMTAGDLFSTYYSPDFKSPDTDPHYGPVDKIETCRFDLDLTGLIEQGTNSLVVAHASPSNPCALAAAEARLFFMPPPLPPAVKAGPPEGPLPRISPRPAHKTVLSAESLPDGLIVLETPGGRLRVESRFSTPEPAWVRGGTKWFTLERSLDVQEDHVIVHDTFTNLTDDNLPLMRRNEISLGANLAELWLGGLEKAGGAGSSGNPANPTTYAATNTGGVGLMPLDDVSRVHVGNYAADGMVGLADNELVLAPGAVNRAEWVIIPTETPNYWEFLNAARRIVGANFTLDGAFAFLRADPNTDAWTDAQVSDFLRFKDAQYVCASISYPMYLGRYTHGTSFQRIPLDSYKNSFARWKGLAPDIKTLVYFHCFIDVTDEGPEAFADARLLQPDGTHANYGVPHDRIYIPTESNRYGAEIAKNVDLILDDIKADGVYWDEHEYSRFHYHYGGPWDGWSGDIDRTKMTVARLKSSVTLLSESWRVALAKRILARGPLIGNGPPFTRAMMELKFPCFVETGSITNCVQAHLWSPVALGDHLTERSEVDAYRTMLGALDHGCVYHWYNDLTVVPTRPQLTRHMYPITPVELRAGCVIGAERIVTKMSGLYGWNDASAHETHVYDDMGREVESFEAPLLRENGMSWTELRIAEDWSAVIVRRGKV